MFKLKLKFLYSYICKLCKSLRLKAIDRVVVLNALDLEKALTTSLVITKVPLEVITDPKECWRTLGVAKFTDTGKALKAWCLEMDELYSSSEKEGVKDTSFASEAALEDPTSNTKMVV